MDLPDLSRRYPVWFCDIWGVVHNGDRPYAETVRALTKHRSSGGRVVLISNSPRTGAGVEKQLTEIGVDRACWDAVVTSGDVTRDLILRHGGGLLFHLGPTRDVSLFAGLDVKRVPLAEAKAIICTGLFHEERETPDDYIVQFGGMVDRRLPMICANPDKVVRKGDKLFYCAGALAERYAALGGEVLMAGKPFAPIYELAIARAKASKSQILAIGDGPETDVLGAANFGIPVILILGGINQESANLTQEVKARVPAANILGTAQELQWH